jgi:hypothetical protein
MERSGLTVETRLLMLARHFAWTSMAHRLPMALRFTCVAAKAGQAKLGLMTRALSIFTEQAH